MDSSKKKVIEFYQEASKDYEFWSKDYNMHFGLAVWNIFDREKMLRKMNDEVLKNVVSDEKGCYLDAGCGCGGTLRQGCNTYKKAKFYGLTISKWQIEKCNYFFERDKIENGNIQEADYHNIPFKNDSFDGAYTLESFCHSNNRKKVLTEFNRVLKKNSKLIITDGFVKVEPQKQGWFFKKCYRTLCNGFALPDVPNINLVKRQLNESGFDILEIKDLSWQISPSVFHANFVIIKYLIFCLIGKNRLKKGSINNLKGSFISLIIGLQRNKFSYYQIISKKR